MERLTYWNCKEKGSALPVSINGDGDVVGLETLCAKLAAYEDTELEPDLVQHLAELYSNPSPNWLADRQELATYRALGPIAHLRELVEAEREGTIPPCGVGDTVWTNTCILGCARKKKKPYQCKVIFVGLCDDGEGYINVAFKDDRTYQFSFADIGKTVFFTRAEAETALEAHNEQ